MKGKVRQIDKAAAGKGRGEKHWAVNYGDNRVTVNPGMMTPRAFLMGEPTG